MVAAFGSPIFGLRVLIDEIFTGIENAKVIIDYNFRNSSSWMCKSTPRIRSVFKERILIETGESSSF
jgi:hypothetical protein